MKRYDLGEEISQSYNRFISLLTSSTLENTNDFEKTQIYKEFLVLKEKISLLQPHRENLYFLEEIEQLGERLFSQLAQKYQSFNREQLDIKEQQTIVKLQKKIAQEFNKYVKHYDFFLRNKPNIYVGKVKLLYKKQLKETLRVLNSIIEEKDPQTIVQKYDFLVANCNDLYNSDSLYIEQLYETICSISDSFNSSYHKLPHQVSQEEKNNLILSLALNHKKKLQEVINKIMAKDNFKRNAFGTVLSLVLTASIAATNLTPNTIPPPTPQQTQKLQEINGYEQELQKAQVEIIPYNRLKPIKPTPLQDLIASSMKLSSKNHYKLKQYLERNKENLVNSDQIKKDVTYLGGEISSTSVNFDGINEKLGKILVTLAKKEQVHPKIILSLAMVESSFGKNNTTSSAGAKGVIQVMDKTLEANCSQELEQFINKYGNREGRKRFHNDLYINILGGIREVKNIALQFNLDVSTNAKPLTLGEQVILFGAYNRGRTAVNTNVDSIFKTPETANYIKKTMTIYNLKEHIVSTKENIVIS